MEAEGRRRRLLLVLFLRRGRDRRACPEYDPRLAGATGGGGARTRAQAGAAVVAQGLHDLRRGRPCRRFSVHLDFRERDRGVGRCCD